MLSDRSCESMSLAPFPWVGWDGMGRLGVRAVAAVERIVRGYHYLYVVAVGGRFAGPVPLNDLVAVYQMSPRRPASSCIQCVR